MPFSAGSNVDVREIDSTTWELLQALDYDGNKEHFSVPVGMRTDFASVPRVFVWFLPRYGRYTKAAILHDYLCGKSNPSPVSRVDADGIFRRVMRELGVPFLRRWIMWAAVRWGALVVRGGRQGWLKESPRVLLVSAIALPIVLPPAFFIVIALVAFYFMEMAGYAMLQMSTQARHKLGHRGLKQVNKPAASWTL